ncbi:MAG: VOC family protein [Actinomycetota bacterium]
MTGFVDHVGIGVPDLAATKAYYDELTAILGLKQWFAGSVNYGPDGALGTQLFFYEAGAPGDYERSRSGFHHLAFLVESRDGVRAAHAWASGRGDTILDEPQPFPQYGPDCFATYWLDPHGFKLEAVCHSPDAG